MIGEIPEKEWLFNNDDVLPTEGVKNWQPATNVDTDETFVFDAAQKKWKPI